MELYVKCAFILACIIVCLHYGTKILDWFIDKEEKLFKDEKSRFISDMYKMKQKYLKRGQYEYCQAIEAIIQAFNLPSEEEPETDYGKKIKKNINDAEEEF